jgi:hypothetical protein
MRSEAPAGFLGEDEYNYAAPLVAVKEEEEEEEGKRRGRGRGGEGLHR